MGQKGSTQNGGIKVSASVSALRDRLPDFTVLSPDGTSTSARDPSMKPILNPFYRELVVDCFSRAHPEMGARILQRTCQHRDDVKQFFAVAGNEVRVQFREVLLNYLRQVIANIDDAEMVRKLSHDYGRAHVALRLIGFKPDFFAALADSITSECVFMGADAMTQTPTNTFKAWTQLVGVMFSSVRDGFYSEMRKLRRQTPDGERMSSPLETIKGSKQSLSVDSSGSSVFNDDSGVDSNESYQGTLRSKSPSPHCSAPVSPMTEVPRKQSAPALGRTNPGSGGTTPTRGTPRSARAAGHKAEAARRAYSGARSQTALTPASSTEFLDKNTGFYRTTHHSQETAALPKPPVSGRFQKNASLDVDTKRKRLEEISRKHAAHAILSRKKSNSAGSVFDPNSVIERFINDKL